METKKTKIMFFEELRELVMAAEQDNDRQDELLSFIDKEVEILNKRKVAAKERAEKKKAESDALTDQIFAVLSDEFMTLDDIMVEFEGNEEVTRNKVTSRLGKLVRNGMAEKEDVKVGDRKRKAYRRVVEEAAA